MKKFSLRKAAPTNEDTELTYNGINETNNVIASPPVLPPYQMPTSTRIKYTLYVVFMSVMMFFLGILFTLNMQQHVLSGPLAVVQRPILEASHIPPQAHKQWLDLQESIQNVDHYFYDRDKIDYTKIYYAASQAALQTLNDTYTRFEAPQTASAMTDYLNGHGGAGLGVELRVLQNKITFVDVFPNNPADKAGLKTSDVLVKIEGKDIAQTGDVGKDLQQISTQLQGDLNTKVTMTIQRPSDNNRQLDITITRGNIERPLVESKLLPGNIGYVKLKDSFGDKTADEFTRQTQQLVNEGATKFVLDVRQNGGGYVDAAQKVLGHFLPNGTAFYEKTWDGNGYVQNETQVKPADTLKLYDAPLVVLVDKDSASASEITAGALQGRGRAALIGEQTYGKGVAQYVLPLEDGAASRITYAHWLTPTKVDIGHTGLTPNVPIAFNQTDNDAGRDTQLERAVQFLQSGEKVNQP